MYDSMWSDPGLFNTAREITLPSFHFFTFLSRKQKRLNAKTIQ